MTEPNSAGAQAIARTGEGRIKSTNYTLITQRKRTQQLCGAIWHSFVYKKRNFSRVSRKRRNNNNNNKPSL